jgi:hypothetical protein
VKNKKLACQLYKREGPLYRRKVGHPQAHDNYRVLIKDDGAEIGSIGVQIEGRAWPIDTRSLCARMTRVVQAVIACQGHGIDSVQIRLAGLSFLRSNESGCGELVRGRAMTHRPDPAKPRPLGRGI